MFTARYARSEVVTVSLGYSVIIAMTGCNVRNLLIPVCTAQSETGEADINMDLRKFLYITGSMI